MTSGRICVTIGASLISSVALAQGVSGPLPQAGSSTTGKEAALESLGVVDPTPPPPPAIEAKAPEAAGTKPELKIGGGIYIWHYQPLLSGGKAFTDVYAAWVVFDGSWGDFGVHFEPRFRNSPLRAFFQSNIWAQEAYGKWTTPIGALKFGKVYTKFGRFWDGSFYGNLPYFDGLKLDTDMGLSLEGARGLSDTFDLDYALQFFIVDGQTNGSLPGRDTLSVMGARERNEVVGRLAGTFKPDDMLSVTVGVSGQAYQADFADPAEDQTVIRVNGETELGYGPLGVWLDVTKQVNGRAVIDYPVVGKGSKDVIWAWTGAYMNWKFISLRYNLSWVKYEDAKIEELFHHPGATFTVHDNISILAEYVHWTSGSAKYDESFNLILYGSF
jgi:hypothetical protein